MFVEMNLVYKIPQREIEREKERERAFDHKNIKILYISMKILLKIQ